MRLSEIVAATRTVLATNRFKHEYDDEVLVNPGFRDALSNFLRFKETARADAQFNRKDAPFRFNALKGHRHCHLIHGRRIICYDIDATTIYLLALTDHSAYDGHSPQIAPYVKGLAKADFSSFAPVPAPPEASTTTPAPGTPELMSEVYGLVYALAASDRGIVETLAQGSMTRSFLELISLIPAEPRDVLRGFGTKDRMMAFAEKVLKDTKVAT